MKISDARKLCKKMLDDRELSKDGLAKQERRDKVGLHFYVIQEIRHAGYAKFTSYDGDTVACPKHTSVRRIVV
jgi:hypothetical protein